MTLPASFHALPALLLTSSSAPVVWLGLLALLLVAALAATAWWYARINQASIAALHELARRMHEQSRVVDGQIAVVRQQMDLIRRQWEQEHSGRLEFWLTAVDDEELRMPFKPPFGSRRDTLISGWILEVWNPSRHLVRLLSCTLSEMETGVAETAGPIRLMRAEETWVLPVTEVFLRLLDQVSRQRFRGNWRKLQEHTLSVEISLRYLGNDGVEQTLRQSCQVRLGGGWERFELNLAGPAAGTVVRRESSLAAGSDSFSAEEGVSAAPAARPGAAHV